MKADVPQRSYAVTPQTFNLRIDLAASINRQANAAHHPHFLQHLWLSQLAFEHRGHSGGGWNTLPDGGFPCSLTSKSTAPAGFYAMPQRRPCAGNHIRPGFMIKTWCAVLCPMICLCCRRKPARSTAHSFPLAGCQPNNISSNLISVTSESVLLDTMLVEQVLYPMKSVDINLTGITTGQPAPGYHVASVTADLLCWHCRQQRFHPVADTAMWTR